MYFLLLITCWIASGCLTATLSIDLWTTKGNTLVKLKKAVALALGSILFLANTYIIMEIMK